MANNKRLVRRHLLVRGTRHPYGPLVHHAVLALGSVELEFQNLLVDRVAALACDASDGTLGTRREENLVFAEKAVLEHDTEHIASGNVVSDLEVARGKVPFLHAVESGQVDATGNVDAVGFIGDALEGTLNTVVDGLHQPGAELDRQGLLRPIDRVAHGYTGYAVSALSSIRGHEWGVPVSS